MCYAYDGDGVKMGSSIEEIKQKGTRLPRSRFDVLCKEGSIMHPLIENFGDWFGNQHRPSRTIYGNLIKEDGTVELVWTLSDDES